MKSLKTNALLALLIAFAIGVGAAKTHATAPTNDGDEQNGTRSADTAYDRGVRISGDPQHGIDPHNPHIKPTNAGPHHASLTDGDPQHGISPRPIILRAASANSYVPVSEATAEAIDTSTMDTDSVYLLHTDGSIRYLGKKKDFGKDPKVQESFLKGQDVLGESKGG